MIPIPVTDVALRIACALVCGIIVGAERQWHQRTAGLRTYALVSVGAALFLLLGRTSGDPTSEARIVGQIITGIGFLGAGVIMRNPNSASIKGINTAGTIWGVSAVGCLAGAGLYVYTFLGTASLLLINVLLRPLVDQINNRPEANPEINIRYTLSLRCPAPKAAHLRQLLTQLTVAPLHLQQLDSDNKGDECQLKASIGSTEREDALIERLTSRLAAEQDILGISWHARGN